MPLSCCILANDEAPIPMNTAESTGDVDAETKEKSSPGDLPLNMPMTSGETSMPDPLQEEQSNIKVTLSDSQRCSYMYICKNNIIRLINRPSQVFRPLILKKYPKSLFSCEISVSD